LKVTDHMIEYENSILEKKYPEFRYLMNEFHDGMLLFEISGRKVWNRVSNDSTGIHLFYEDHKNNWLSKSAIDARVYILKQTGDGEKALASSFNRFSGKQDFDIALQKKFNKGNDTVLVIREGTWYKGDNADIDRLSWKPGLQSFRMDNFPSMIFIEKILEPVPLKFEKVQGEVMASYQEYLENEWIGQLNKKYNVKIDNQVLDEVKKKLKNE
jgi:peptidyl-prolyl cis-trans isomerase SurA